MDVENSVIAWLFFGLYQIVVMAGIIAFGWATFLVKTYGPHKKSEPQPLTIPEKFDGKQKLNKTTKSESVESGPHTEQELIEQLKQQRLPVEVTPSQQIPNDPDEGTQLIIRENAAPGQQKRPTRRVELHGMTVQTAQAQPVLTAATPLDHNGNQADDEAEDVAEPGHYEIKEEPLKEPPIKTQPKAAVELPQKASEPYVEEPEEEFEEEGEEWEEEEEEEEEEDDAPYTRPHRGVARITARPSSPPLEQAPPAPAPRPVETSRRIVSEVLVQKVNSPQPAIRTPAPVHPVNTTSYNTLPEPYRLPSSSPPKHYATVAAPAHRSEDVASFNLPTGGMTTLPQTQTEYSDLAKYQARKILFGAIEKTKEKPVTTSNAAEIHQELKPKMVAAKPAPTITAFGAVQHSNQ